MVILTELPSTGSYQSNRSNRNVALSANLLNLTRSNGYELIQTNGQRVYSPSAAMNIKAPPRGCEIFIGKIGKNIYEDELIPLFEEIGPLYMFRLMLDFKEKSRGYAFATYFSPKHADRAVHRFNGYELRRGLYIGVFKSVDNRRLFVGSIPVHINKGELYELLARYVDGIVKIIMYNDYLRPHLNRGFAFVEFENHRLAAMARRQFSPGNLVEWGQTLYVDWSDPLPDVHPRIMAKVSILYLKNLPISVTSEEIHAFVCNVVGQQLVKKVHKINNYAFAHFVDRRSAEYALRRLKGIALYVGTSRHYLEVEWARPRSFSKKARQAAPPNNFCTSVPPNMRRMVIQRTMNNSDTVVPWNSSIISRTVMYNSFARNIGSNASSPCCK